MSFPEVRTGENEFLASTDASGPGCPIWDITGCMVLDSAPNGEELDVRFWPLRDRQDT